MSDYESYINTLNSYNVKYNVKSHYIRPLQAELVLKFRDVASQVAFCFAVDSISLTPLYKVLPDGLSVGDTNWLLAMSLVAPSLCVVVAAHNAVPNLCEQPLSVCHQ